MEMLLQNEEDFTDTARAELRRKWQAIRMTPTPIPNLELGLGHIHFSQDEIDEIDSCINNTNNTTNRLSSDR